MSKVYVVQAPARRTGPSGAWEEKYDLSPAEEFGELVRVLPYGNVPEDPRPTRDALLEAFDSFDTRKDFILLLGDPVACAQAVYVLASDFQLGHFNVLKWDRRAGKYRPYRIG